MRMATVNSKRIKERVDARRSAEQLIELGADYTASGTEDSRELFWSVVRDHALQIAPLPAARAVQLPPQLDVMSDAEARLFEQRIVPFGQYKGARVSEVPLTYIDWLVGQGDEFRKAASRYVLNPQIMQMIDEAIAENKAEWRKGREQ